MFIELIGLFATLISYAPETTFEQHSTEVIHDFSGNRFILEENENSYSIYDSLGNFIEGSDESNSAYYNYDGNDKYYLGPLNYYIKKDNKVIDLLDNKNYSLDEMEGNYYSLKDCTYISNNSVVPDIDIENTYVDTNGFLMIKNANYFQRLKEFPKNWFGECGIVALSMLLSYFDTFYNPNFIHDDKMYEAKYYKDVVENGEEKKVLDFKRSEYLMEKEITSYQEDNSIPYSYEKYWEMPGTTYAMRDYLFDNYMDTFAGFGNENDGFPMLDGELRSTINDYLIDNCENILKFIELYNYSFYINMHENIISFINEGYPVLTVLQSYESKTPGVGNGGNHIVLCYGYKEEKDTQGNKNYIFIAHFGWSPGTNNYTTIKFSSGAIYGCFGMKYKGAHIHSSNVYMTNEKNITKFSCPCGIIHSEIYNIPPKDWNFEQRYYFENEGIKETKFTLEDFEVNTRRLRCGFIENEVVNLSPNRLNAGDAYFEMKFNKNIKQMDVDISFWSDEEYLNKLLGDYAYIQIKDKLGVWQTEIDLLDYGISTDRYNQTKISVNIPQYTKAIRFISHVEIPLSARNKGRISIGDIKLYVGSF